MKDFDYIQIPKENLKNMVRSIALSFKEVAIFRKNCLNSLGIDDIVTKFDEMLDSIINAILEIAGIERNSKEYARYFQIVESDLLQNDTESIEKIIYNFLRKDQENESDSGTKED